jgi:nucleotide-binding universal stress UspA family protein
VSSLPIALPEILLATDFCEPARRALAFARQIARRRSAPIHAAHVLDLTGPDPAIRRSFSTAHDSAKRSLREIRLELRLAGIENSATLISAGNAADAIRGLVQLHQPSLLVLGLNGALSQDPAALGATARSLLAAPPCPILTVSELCLAPSAHAAERVVIVIDTAPDSLRAALDAWPLGPRPTSGALLTIRSKGTKTVPTPPAALQHQFHPVQGIDPKNAADAILRHAKETTAGLIVVAFGSGTRLASLNRGALACTLLTQASCPVLTVRS